VVVEKCGQISRKVHVAVRDGRTGKGER
jgi:hypothetical protein